MADRPVSISIRLKRDQDSMSSLASSSACLRSDVDHAEVSHWMLFTQLS